MKKKRVVLLLSFLVMGIVLLSGCTEQQTEQISPEETTGGENNNSEENTEEKDSGSQFELSNLTVSSTQIYRQEAIEATVDVKNTGDTSGMYTVSCYIDNTFVEAEEESFVVGQSKQIYFEVIESENAYFNEVGTYELKVNDLSTTIQVLEPPLEIELKKIEWVNPQEYVEENQFSYDGEFHTSIPDGNYCPVIKFKVINPTDDTFKFAKIMNTGGESAKINCVTRLTSENIQREPFFVSSSGYEGPEKWIPWLYNFTLIKGNAEDDYVLPSKGEVIIEAFFEIRAKNPDGSDVNLSNIRIRKETGQNSVIYLSHQGGILGELYL